METNNGTNDGDLGHTKWNDHQEKHEDGLNEGFSSENLAPDFDPGAHDNRPMDSETEFDENGNPRQVERARFPDEPKSDTEGGGAFASNEAIEHPKSTQNRDFNYDRDAGRFPPDHPENHKNRGNEP